MALALRRALARLVSVTRNAMPAGIVCFPVQSLLSMIVASMRIFGSGGTRGLASGAMSDIGEQEVAQCPNDDDNGNYWDLLMCTVIFTSKFVAVFVETSTIFSSCAV